MPDPTVIEVLIPGPQGPAGSGGGGTAATVTYDNGASGLAGDNVQEAIDELAADIPAQALGAGASPTFAGLTLSGLAAAGILVAGVGGALGAVPNQSPNLFYAGPASGAAAAPTFRAMVVGDISFAGQANGLATLDGGGKIPSAQLSALAITETFVVASQVAMLALTAERGDVAVRSDLNKSFILATDSPETLADWKELLTPTDAVLSVAGLTGAISAAGLKSALTLVAGDISGLGTSATVNTGTSGATIPLLNGVNTWSGQNTFAAGSIAASAPHTWTQTWNNAGVTFTGLLVNVTDTASAAAGISGSRLISVGVGGGSFVEKLGVGKDGTVWSATGSFLRNQFANSGMIIDGNSDIGFFQNSSTPKTYIQNAIGLRISAANYFGWSSGADASLTADLALSRDAANTLAQRNGTNAQRSKKFNTWTDASNGEWFDIDWITNANVATIGTNKNGSGATRALKFIAGGTAWLDVSTTGAAVFVSSITAGQIISGAASGFAQSGRGIIYFNSDGVLAIYNTAGSDFNRLQFGGTTSSFPALKRSATVLQARLADDSAFAPLQGNLRTQANAVAETPTATHTQILTDAAGTAYRVLCVI